MGAAPTARESHRGGHREEGNDAASGHAASVPAADQVGACAG